MNMLRLARRGTRSGSPATMNAGCHVATQPSPSGFQAKLPRGNRGRVEQFQVG